MQSLTRAQGPLASDIFQTSDFPGSFSQVHPRLSAPPSPFPAAHFESAPIPSCILASECSVLCTPALWDSPGSASPGPLSSIHACLCLHVTGLVRDRSLESPQVPHSCQCPSGSPLLSEDTARNAAAICNLLSWAWKWGKPGAADLGDGRSVVPVSFCITVCP